MNTRLFLIVACSLGLAGNVNAAEGPAREEPAPPRRFPAGAEVVPWAYVPRVNYWWASTAEQGYLDGWANVIDAEGRAILNGSIASERFERARLAAMLNAVAEQQCLQQMRISGREHRRELRGPPVTHQQAVRIAKLRSPARVSSSRLGLEQGRIDWPGELRDERFALDRRLLERMFRQVTDSQNCPLRYQDFKEVTDRMSLQLIERIKLLPPQTYLESRKFLTGLAEVARTIESNRRFAVGN